MTATAEGAERAAGVESESRIWGLAPLLAALVVMIVAGVLILSASLRANDGHLIYSLDDPYIHMAMARNLAEHGAYGLTPREFTSSSSSPGWVLLLAAAFRVAGTHDWTALVLAAAGATLALFATHRLCRAHDLSVAGTSMALAGVLLLTPMIPQIFTGMEHALHIALLLLFTAEISRMLAHEPSRSATPTLLRSLVLVALATSIRMETAFVVGPVALALFLMRRRRDASLLCAAAAVPVVAYGLVSLANGSMLLPNPIVVKGAFPRVDGLRPLVESLGGRSLRTLTRPNAPHLWSLAIALCALYTWNLRRVGARAPRQILVATTVAAILLHCQFGVIGAVYRYEAYLVALGVCIGVVLVERDVAPSLRTALRSPNGTALAIALLLLIALIAVRPLRRGVKALTEVVPSTTNIYRQQVQMARFLNEHYRGQGVAANDIGALHYFASIRCLDLGGLGSREVARAVRDRTMDTAAIRRLAHAQGVRVAVVYANWFRAPGALPPEWIEVGTWTIPDNVVCGDATVYFLATSAGEAVSLESALRAFAPRLPSEVAQAGRYVDGR